MKQLVVIIRTKASATVGFGHLRRCITLAKELHQRGIKPVFITNQEHEIAATLESHQLTYFFVADEDEKTFKETSVYLQSLQANALIIDTYDILNPPLPSNILPRVVIIEDRKNINHVAKVVVNAANEEDPSSPQLLGEKYILLDDVYSNLPEKKIKHEVQEILITAGGADPFHVSPQLVSVTHEIYPKSNIHVVIGPFFNDAIKEELTGLAAKNPKIHLHSNLINLFSVMQYADLAISAGGQTLYELAATGTPTLAFKLFDNQTDNLQRLASRGVLVYAGDWHAPYFLNQFTAALINLVADLNARQTLSRQGRAFVDGQGTKRIANIIESMCH